MRWENAAPPASHHHTGHGCPGTRLWLWSLPPSPIPGSSQKCCISQPVPWTAWPAFQGCSTWHRTGRISQTPWCVPLPSALALARLLGEHKVTLLHPSWSREAGTLNREAGSGSHWKSTESWGLRSMRLRLEDAGRRGPQQSPEPKGLYKETLEQNLSWARQGEVWSQEEGVESYLQEAKCNRRRGSEK